MGTDVERSRRARGHAARRAIHMTESGGYRFGAFELDGQTGELKRRGLRVRLRGRPIEILRALLERRGELVSRDELRARLWTADTFVDFDHGLNSAVNKLREALDDTAENPRFIETLPRRGYRWIGPAEPLAPALRPAEQPALEPAGEPTASTTVSPPPQPAAASAMVAAPPAPRGPRGSERPRPSSAAAVRPVSRHTRRHRRGWLDAGLEGPAAARGEWRRTGDGPSGDARRAPVRDRRWWTRSGVLRRRHHRGDDFADWRARSGAPWRHRPDDRDAISGVDDRCHGDRERAERRVRARGQRPSGSTARPHLGPPRRRHEPNPALERDVRAGPRRMC